MDLFFRSAANTEYRLQAPAASLQPNGRKPPFAFALSASVSRNPPPLGSGTPPQVMTHISSNGPLSSGQSMSICLCRAYANRRSNLRHPSYGPKVPIGSCRVPIVEDIEDPSSQCNGLVQVDSPVSRLYQ